MSESLRSLTKNKRCEPIAQVAHQKLSEHKWFAQVAHQKWATISESLRLLTKNEGLSTNCSGRSTKMKDWANWWFFWANRSFNSFFRKKQAIRSENRWANSQPCIELILHLYETNLEKFYSFWITVHYVAFGLWTIVSVYYITIFS